MAFENVVIRTTLNGITPVQGYREDLSAADLVALSLIDTSTGLPPVATSYEWEILGRPEGSTAGGPGPEPIALGLGSTAAFTVDGDVPIDHSGTYKLRCTLNGGSGTETHIGEILVRLSGLSLTDGRTLRFLGGFEDLDDDTSVPLILQGWATQLNRWLHKVEEIAGGGPGPGGQTLKDTYNQGTLASHQTMTLLDAKGGRIVVDASNAGFTGLSAIKVLGTGGQVLFNEAAAGIAVDTTNTLTAAAMPLHVKDAAGATLRLQGLQTWDVTGGSSWTVAMAAGPTMTLGPNGGLSFTANAAEGYLALRSRGSFGVPTAVHSGDLLGYFGGGGFGTAFTGPQGYLGTYATETWTGTAHGTELELWTTPNTAAAAIKRITVAHNGMVLPGGDNTLDLGAVSATRWRSGYFGTDLVTGDAAATFARLGAGFLRVYELAAAPATVANAGSFYSKDVAGLTLPFWVDSAGTEYQLTTGAGIIGGSGAAKQLAWFSGGSTIASDPAFQIDDGTGRLSIGAGAIPLYTIDVRDPSDTPILNLQTTTPGGSSGLLLQTDTGTQGLVGMDGSGGAGSGVPESLTLTALGANGSAVRITDRSGLGVANEIARFDLATSLTAFADYSLGYIAAERGIHVLGYDSTRGAVMVDVYATADQPTYFLRRARGNAAVPTNMGNNDVVGSLQLLGCAGGGYESQGRIDGVYTTNVGNGDRGAGWDFYTAQLGVESRSVRISGLGNLLVGTTTEPAAGGPGNVVVEGSGDGDGTLLLNSGDFYLASAGDQMVYKALGDVRVKAGAGDVRVAMAGGDTYAFTQAGDASMLGDAVFAPAVDNTGQLGTDALRFKRIRAATVVSGDLHLQDEARGAHWTLREEADGITAINVMTGKRYRLAMTPEHSPDSRPSGRVS